MTLDISIFIYILIVHFLADFALQTQEQSNLKSTDENQLAFHVSTYSIVWLFASYIILNSWFSSIGFAIVTWIIHYSTDYASSRLQKPYWDKKDYHNAFVLVGADQVFHYVQLIYTYVLLK